MILYLRSVSPEEFFFGISAERKKYSKIFNIPLLERIKFLEFLAAFFCSQHVTFSSLTEIIVLTSQSSSQGFSQIRMMITIANTLALSLKIPIYGVNNEEWNILWNNLGQKFHIKSKRFVFPLYNKEPNITQ